MHGKTEPYTKQMPVSSTSSKLIYDALKECDIRLVSALPETWLVHLIRLADDDPEMILVRLAKEEEGVGVSAGAHFAGVKSAMLMQNHGFLASINGIVSFAHLYKIPLLMLISYRGTFGERDPWQTQGGNITESVLRALGIPYSFLDTSDSVKKRIRQAQMPRGEQLTASCSSSDTRPDVGGAVMLRIDCLRSIYAQLEDCLVVTIMGAVAAELQSLGHRPNFFYLQHAMGLASSTGLGLALCLPEQRVVVLDGDGSLLMNLGGLSTMARYRPRNLVHVVFDNESLLSVGGFPTATSTGTDLEGIARAAGIPRVSTVRSQDDFKATFGDAMRSSELTTIIAKVEAKGPAGYVTDLSLLENRFQFRRYIQSITRP